jgi:hypothetical protein
MTGPASPPSNPLKGFGCLHHLTYSIASEVVYSSGIEEIV